MKTNKRSALQAQRHAAAQELLDSTKSVSAAPPVAFQLSSLIRDPGCSSEAIVKLIELDPDLTAQLLRLVNTVEFRGHGVGSLNEAIVRLGTDAIASKAMSVTVGRMLAIRKTAYCPDPIGLWRHSVECALACRYLSRACEGVPWNPNIAFTCGLLHDIGKIVINAAPPEALEVLGEVMYEEGMSGADAELAVLGADHAEIGGLMLELWNLPSQVATGVRFHHAPEFDRSGLAVLVHVGNCCAKVHANSRAWTDFEESLQPFALEQLRLPLAEIQECWGEVLQDMDGIERFMSRS
jgi:putative nucleotidyltransferase with HDIG domain